MGPKLAPNLADTHSPQSNHAELHSGSVSLRDQRGWVFTTSLLRQNHHLPFIATSHQTSGRELGAKPDPNAIKS